ncbi:MAG: rRNA maturation RNase YbeY [Gemmataceae bacterium]
MLSKQQEISVTNQQEVVPIDPARCREVAEVVLGGESISSYEIGIAFVDNKAIHELNVRFLGHDYPTDILTFPDTGPRSRPLSGELVISAEYASEEAKERGHAVADELALYVIHGILHLCGEDDKSEEDSAHMRESERYYLGELGLPDITHDDD